MKEKTWNRIVIAGTVGILAIIAVITIIIDPFFHYHKPLESLEYPMLYERYQNDGIARWYSYDAMITGTSMTQNFKTSEFDMLMGVTSVKTSYHGATFNELSDNIERALEYNDDLKIVLCSLDGNNLNIQASENQYEGVPSYLCDDNVLNDVNYLLNKDVMTKTLAVVNYTRAGNKTPSMDEYGRWSQYRVFGEEEVRKYLPDLPQIDEEIVLTEEDKERIRENVTVNFLELAQKYPETDFYLFIPPYSRCFWEALSETKQLNAQIEAEMIAVEVLLSADNIYLYGYADRQEIVGNLDYYTDSLHYSEDINSEILKMISVGDGRLTQENYMDYYQTIREMYE